METLRHHISKALFTACSLLAPFLFTSCEEVIDLDLSDVENQIVIEGTVSSDNTASVVKLSFTTSAFKKSQTKSTKGAVVTLTDDAGNSEVLRETTTGVFVPARIAGVPNRTYTLRVEFEGREYSGTSTMPAPMGLDSIRCINLYYVPQMLSPVVLEYYLTNKPGVEEYCLIKTYQPGDRAFSWTIYSDKYSDGKQVVVDGPVFASTTPTIIVDLISIDRATYEFLFALREVTDSDADLPEILNTNEYNPKSNLTNNALGYFSAQAQTRYVVSRR